MIAWSCIYHNITRIISYCTKACYHCYTLGNKLLFYRHNILYLQMHYTCLLMMDRLDNISSGMIKYDLMSPYTHTPWVAIFLIYIRVCTSFVHYCNFSFLCAYRITEKKNTNKSKGLQPKICTYFDILKIQQNFTSGRKYFLEGSIIPCCHFFCVWVD